MSNAHTTILEYAASPVVAAYANLKTEFQRAKEFRGTNAVHGNVPAQTSTSDDKKPSGRAYLVLAGTVVTLLAPLKIAGCLVSLLLNYAYLPVTLVLVGLVLLLRKIGWTANRSPVECCIGVVAVWLIAISYIMARLTTAKHPLNESSVYINKLHFIQKKIENSLIHPN
ncbi:MAG: hypothetical protein LBS68_02485 [Puniceicoccales bacterium]|jgi:hypothetical protein|nr:hypothetical protein [Puniceicoccales bacterium]